MPFLQAAGKGRPGDDVWHTQSLQVELSSHKPLQQHHSRFSNSTNHCHLLGKVHAAADILPYIPCATHPLGWRQLLDLLLLLVSGRCCCCRRHRCCRHGLNVVTGTCIAPIHRCGRRRAVTPMLLVLAS